MALPHVQEAIRVLKALILERKRRGDEIIPPKDIYDAVAHLYPPEKLYLHDPADDLQQACREV